jgi:hypothetical protein
MGPLCAVVAPSLASCGCEGVRLMADVLYVVLLIAIFLALALTLRGLERL